MRRATQSIFDMTLSENEPCPCCGKRTSDLPCGVTRCDDGEHTYFHYRFKFREGKDSLTTLGGITRVTPHRPDVRKWARAHDEIERNRHKHNNVYYKS